MSNESHLNYYLQDDGTFKLSMDPAFEKWLYAEPDFSFRFNFDKIHAITFERTDYKPNTLPVNYIYNEACTYLKLFMFMFNSAVENDIQDVIPFKTGDKFRIREIVSGITDHYFISFFRDSDDNKNPIPYIYLDFRLTPFKEFFSEKKLFFLFLGILCEYMNKENFEETANGFNERAKEWIAFNDCDGKTFLLSETYNQSQFEEMCELIKVDTGIYDTAKASEDNYDWIDGPGACVTFIDYEKFKTFIGILLLPFVESHLEFIVNELSDEEKEYVCNACEKFNAIPRELFNKIIEDRESGELDYSYTQEEALRIFEERYGK